MKVKVEYWNPKNETVVTETGFRYLDTTSVITRTEVWEDTEENIFRKFDKENNRLRYCNGSFYKFEDDAITKQYREWYSSLDETTKFNMYYGHGVVD